MPKGLVLVVDDDEDIRQLVGKSLASRGYRVSVVTSGEEGLEAALTEKPDLIILDIEMPGMDGIQTCQEIRKSLFCPILFLSVRADDTDIVLGLGVGADNYLTKPFNIPELLAHVDAAMRRESIYSRRQAEPELLHIKDLTLDLTAHELTRGGSIIRLSPTEFKLLHALARNSGRVLSRDQLLDCAWDTQADGVYSRTVDVHIGRIRRKIGDDPRHPRYILTVPGLGYRVPGS